jgi:molecular chaperone HscA
VRAALAADAALLSAAEREAIERQAAALAAVASTNDHRAIKQASEALNRATEEFAGRRMDAGVRRALAGKRLANLDL